MNIFYRPRPTTKSNEQATEVAEIQKDQYINFLFRVFYIKVAFGFCVIVKDRINNPVNYGKFYNFKLISGDLKVITGSAVALHCCKAHAKSIGKMGNSTPCKIVTPENIILKLCIRD